jgi:thiamine-monophosphate kinase
MADDGLPDEFTLIRRYFAPLATHAGAVGLGDDVALLAPSSGTVHVLKTDTIVEGVHYLPDDPPDLVAKKLLRVNLSDLAAKGARPVGYLLAASFSRATRESWLAAFVSGLAADQREFGLSLLGGDTTATPGPTTLSVTAIGEAPADKVPRRGGAKPGHDVFVTGTLGDAALGLRVLKGVLRVEGAELLVRRFRLPEPRVALGAEISAVATAAIDVSDGLAADLGHICEESHVAAEVERDALPLSPPARAAVAADPILWTDILAGGDDYEILFTAPPGSSKSLPGVSRIGQIVAGEGVRIHDAKGRVIDVQVQGYRHF